MPHLLLSLLSAVRPSSQLRLRFRNFSLEYPDVLSSDGFIASKPQHGVRHHLLTNPGPPVYLKPCRLDPDKLSAAKEEFSAMEKAGIIRRSSSPGRFLSTW